MERIIIAPACAKSDSLVDKRVSAEIANIADHTSAAKPRITLFILNGVILSRTGPRGKKWSGVRQDFELIGR